ncbi:MAG: precorrin-8X methylmutase [Lachnospiraceae bacterium]|nr:precorrin-8X methylmutase [Lachnospiraceae bacterium]
MNFEQVRPEEIEKRSFAIIDAELKQAGITLDARNAPVIMRCIHASADPDYAKTLAFSEGAVDVMQDLIRKGADIVTDTNMALAGINRKRLAAFGGEVRCHMADADVAEKASERGLTRAAVSMEKAAARGGDIIFAVGNAPTALIALYEMMQKGLFVPAFVIGVPVGFVNVVQAKELFLHADVPFIINRGRKGGSSIAAAICNAVLYDM